MAACQFCHREWQRPQGVPDHFAYCPRCSGERRRLAREQQAARDIERYGTADVVIVMMGKHALKMRRDEAEQRGLEVIPKQSGYVV